MNIYDIIEKKKHGQELTKEEINYFVDGYTKGEIPDYQISALLMAICLKNLNLDETVNLANAMLNSGDLVDLSKIKGIKVDKHSTGGVGDTTSLVLGPLVASAGLVFAKMSGRGLGHTGGTLDKLESIPGMRIDLQMDEFINNSNKIGISIIGQTADITPADKKLYALRDSTATVDNISLIASSIMSKKLAVGADALVLDVKVGSGAFMKDVESATKLSEIMVSLGKKFNHKTKALITSMDEPLGFAVGNSLEVIEAINTLKGQGPQDLRQLCLALGSKLLLMSNFADNEDEAKEILETNIRNGKAFEKFKEFVKAQGGDISYIDDTSKFKLSKYKVEIVSKDEDYVKKIDALLIGEIARDLGAGRITKESKIDLGAGIILNKKIDDFVKKGELLATFYTDKEKDINLQVENIYKAYEIGEKNKETHKLIYKEID